MIFHKTSMKLSAIEVRGIHHLTKLTNHHIVNSNTSMMSSGTMSKITVKNGD